MGTVGSNPTPSAIVITIEYGHGTPSPAKPSEVIRGLGFPSAKQEKKNAFVGGPHRGPCDTVAKGNLILDYWQRRMAPFLRYGRSPPRGRRLAQSQRAGYHGTHPWSQPADGNLRFTVGKNGSIYVIALAWPVKELRINAPVPIDGGRVCGSSGRCRCHHEGQPIVVDWSNRTIQLRRCARTVRRLAGPAGHCDSPQPLRQNVDIPLRAGLKSCPQREETLPMVDVLAVQAHLEPPATPRVCRPTCELRPGPAGVASRSAAQRPAFQPA